ncbi:MAG TPA: hypothetical protein VK673_13140 [Chthoniobacterales bacterium]|nr:hypothetical protein [Chthoniobacterales bacterium]
MSDATTKQFGDACEMLVCAELTLAGLPAQKMGDCWPGYDLVAETAAGLKRISVKGLRAGNGKIASWWQFSDEADWDWLALVRVNVETGEREIFLLSREKAIALRKPTADGHYRLWRSNPSLQAYRNNFSLEEHTTVVLLPVWSARDADERRPLSST